MGGTRVFIASSVAKRAEHGVVGVNGPTVAYSPAKGFTGTDHFRIEYALKDEEKALVIYWDVTMIVAP